MRRIVLFALAMGLATAVAAQAYKWVDENGKVRYGDQPPPGVKATPLKGPQPPVSSAPSAPASKKGGEKPLTPEQAFQKRQKEQAEAEQKAAKSSAEEQTRKANCESAQAQLRTVQSGQRISTTNAAGERVYLNDAEREREAARAQQAVREWCSK